MGKWDSWDLSLRPFLDIFYIYQKWVRCMKLMIFIGTNLWLFIKICLARHFYSEDTYKGWVGIIGLEWLEQFCHQYNPLIIFIASIIHTFSFKWNKKVEEFLVWIQVNCFSRLCNTVCLGISSWWMTSARELYWTLAYSCNYSPQRKI